MYDGRIAQGLFCALTFMLEEDVVVTYLYNGVQCLEGMDMLHYNLKSLIRAYLRYNFDHFIRTHRCCKGLVT